MPVRLCYDLASSWVIAVSCLVSELSLSYWLVSSDSASAVITSLSYLQSGLENLHNSVHYELRLFIQNTCIFVTRHFSVLQKI